MNFIKLFTEAIITMLRTLGKLGKKNYPQKDARREAFKQQIKDHNKKLDE